MNDGLGAGRLTADWAVLGKHPGQVMGYEVLDGSLPADRAKPYLWGATTGTPDGRDPADALPWRVFLGSVHTDPSPVCATVETTWDGSRDGTGAPSYAWQLFLVDWGQAGAARLTWSSLDHLLPREQPPPTGIGASLPVPHSPAAELAAQVDELGFAWAARVAALLLDNRQVAIVPGPGQALPQVAERVRVLDAVCSLLPYGCRAWLSAATWTGQADHGLRLVFASGARTGQVEVQLGAGSPPEPQGAVARTYLSELLRLQAKGRTTAELVGHLLGAVAAIPLQNPADAVRALREADLLDSVIEEIRQGRGELSDVQRVLDVHPIDSLGEHRLAVLVPFLARRAQGSGGGLAQAVLRQHWTRLTPQLLAEDVAADGSTEASFERATGYLWLMHATEADHPGVFDELFTALVSDPHQNARWVGSLVYMVEDVFDRLPDSADSFLIRTPEAGLKWLATWLEDRTRSLAPLSRLAARADAFTVGGITGWLRFAAVLTGVAAPGRATENDAAEFLAADDSAWRIALDIAADARRPAVIEPMWSRLRQVAHGPDGPTRLVPALDRLAPPGDLGVTPATAADADLLCAMNGAQGAGTARSMPRLRHITGLGTMDDYTDAVIRRIDTDGALARSVVEALLGDATEARSNSWEVLDRLIARRPGIESTVSELLESRLTANPGPWLDLPLPESLVTTLGRRPHLRWLRSVRDFREHALAQIPSYERLARVIVDGSPSRTFTPQLLGEITAWLIAGGPWRAYFLTTEMDRVDTRMGLKLYSALRTAEGARQLCEDLHRFSLGELAHHQRIMESLSGVSEPAPQRSSPSSHSQPPSQQPPQPAHPGQQLAHQAPLPDPEPQQQQRRRPKQRRILPKRPDWFQGYR